jgi:hypothetical protein
MDDASYDVDDVNDLQLVAALVLASEEAPQPSAAREPVDLIASNAALSQVGAELSLAGVSRPVAGAASKSEGIAEDDESDSSSEAGAVEDSSSGSSSEADSTVDAVLCDDEDGTVVASGGVRSEHETPLTRLPLPALPAVRVSPESAATAIGAITSVHFSKAWDDPFAESAMEGGAGGARRRKSRRKRAADVAVAAVGAEESAAGAVVTEEGASSAAPSAVPASTSPAIAPESSPVVTIVIQGLFNSRPLAEGSLLALSDGRCVGVVEDVFGPVTSPLYISRVRLGGTTIETAKDDGIIDLAAAGGGLAALASDYQVELGVAAPSALPSSAASSASPTSLVSVHDIRIGAVLYAASQHCSYVLPEAVRAAAPAGTDASNLFDEELPPEEQEFSDDEAEARARAERKSSARREGAEGSSGFAVGHDGRARGGTGARGGGRLPPGGGARSQSHAHPPPFVQQAPPPQWGLAPGQHPAQPPPHLFMGPPTGPWGGPMPPPGFAHFSPWATPLMAAPNPALAALQAQQAMQMAYAARQWAAARGGAPG